MYLEARQNRASQMFRLTFVRVKARFKRRATAMPNSIDRIKFDLFSTEVTRRLKPTRAAAV